MRLQLRWRTVGTGALRKAKNLLTAREALYFDMMAGRLTCREACRRMRRMLGLTQITYARLIDVAPRVMADFERGAGNPTLHTLQKIGRLFGFRLTFSPTGYAESWVEEHWQGPRGNAGLK